MFIVSFIYVCICIKYPSTQLHDEKRKILIASAHLNNALTFFLDLMVFCLLFDPVCLASFYIHINMMEMENYWFCDLLYTNTKLWMWTLFISFIYGLDYNRYIMIICTAAHCFIYYSMNFMRHRLMQKLCFLFACMRASISVWLFIVRCCCGAAH